MKVVLDYPPNYDKIIKVLSPNDKTIFTYGDTIYNPHSVTLSMDLHVHESIHQIQQGEFPDGWWDNYLADPEFRLSQEVDAYKAQLHFLYSWTKDKNSRFGIKRRIASMLSGPIYGSMISFDEAMKML